jgi:hypothetical protein
MNASRPWQALGFATITAVSSVAFAGPDGDQCSLHSEIPVERLLRRLSIDLRATVPDMAEYDAVDGKEAVPDAIVDAYLSSDEFRLQMRRYHESLLWTNPLTSLGDVGFSLSTKDLGGGVIVHHVASTTKQKLFRGGDGTHYCQDKPQSALGYTNGIPNSEKMGTDTSGDYYAEGWVDVHPYWEPNPEKTIKVCAFDAQVAATYTLPTSDPDAGTHSCDHVLAGGKAKECGCGPSLNYCMLTGVVSPAVFAGMREQVLRLVDDATGGTRPYSELLTGKRVHYNGPLTHYFRYLGQRQSFTRTQNLLTASDGELPELAYTASDTWIEVERQAPHAGVLTLPAFLLRFQTNRGRANRYRIAFRGEYFQPPSTKDTGCAKEGDDLTQRCVCRSCHVTLEPIAAHFGLFVESGTTSLRDYVRSFASRKECGLGIAPASTAWCDRFYEAVPDLKDPDLRFYKLKALRYDDDQHPSIGENFEAGPEALAKADIESGVFHEVATRHLFEFLMKRGPDLDPTSVDYEGDLIAQLAKEFQAHDNLKLLVKRLVGLPAYRRMP